VDRERVKKNLDEFELADLSRDYRIRALFSMIPCDKKWEVLDLGSGNGEIAEVLKDKVSHITLSDYSDEIVFLLSDRYKDNDAVDVKKIDASSFRIDPSYDIVVITDLIEHLESDVACLERCFRALKPGGMIFLSVPAIPFLYGIRDKKYGHLRRYLKKDLSEKVKKAGFGIAVIKYWNMMGVLPYLVSEKILKKELVGPARINVDSVFKKIINKIIYTLLKVETKIDFLPLGLTLVVIGKKGK